MGCVDCHQGNSEAVTWSSPAYRPDCAGCHANNYKQEAHKKTEVPRTITYTVGELRDCTGSCHLYTDDTFTTIKDARSGEHRARGGEW